MGRVLASRGGYMFAALDSCREGWIQFLGAEDNFPPLNATIGDDRYRWIGIYVWVYCKGRRTGRIAYSSSPKRCLAKTPRR